MIRFEVTPAEANLLLAGLQELPFKASAGLIHKLMEQAQRQQREKDPPPPAPGKVKRSGGRRQLA